MILKNKIKKEKNIDIISFNQEEILKIILIFLNEINNISLFEKKKFFLLKM